MQPSGSYLPFHDFRPAAAAVGRDAAEGAAAGAAATGGAAAEVEVGWASSTALTVL